MAEHRCSLLPDQWSRVCGTITQGASVV